MLTENCLNCQVILQGEKKYCSFCGQKADTPRLTLAHFFHEFFHAFTHTDKGIFYLLKGLASKPGIVAREYVEGKRKKYFNPFTFFIILMGFFVFSNMLFSPPPAQPTIDQNVLSRIPTEQGRLKYISMMTRINKSSNFFRKSGNIVAMVAIPFIAGITWLFYRRKRFNYAEHLTANMMFGVFSNMIFAILIFPLQKIFKSEAIGLQLTFSALFLQVIYLSWSLNGFLQLRTIGQRIKSFLVSLTGIILWGLLSMTMMAVYIYQSLDFYQFFVRMVGGR